MSHLPGPPAWDDLRFEGTRGQPAGASVPVFQKWNDNGAGSVGVFAQHFRPGQDNQLFFEGQFPHSFSQQSVNVRPHIHWSPPDANAGNVIWGIEYCWANVNEVFPLTTLIQAAGAAAGVAKMHQVTGLPVISATLKKISSMVGFRVYRLGTDGGDTYGSNAIFHEVDFHFEQDSLGSAQEFVK